ncbi:uncharacterized protein MELLADRAFT_109481 [Melampsora larici-populina 98AG31]|uniref:Uncharacterized protein n=1 Tax=Melampsora larici-populina (strain 98AG31 / pathotype 3-4-7) TaxID=747676 RepID=F4RWM1_MELLP|nr:uncharacterized protein MELLADRAFT_109481 [Melampsora larici-populina 98AG31]EGG03209.1 hypothetical protein MELLADRAFT_109481 [Melampsora larici-populina 98AG31]
MENSQDISLTQQTKDFNRITRSRPGNKDEKEQQENQEASGSKPRGRGRESGRTSKKVEMKEEGRVRHPKEETTSEEESGSGGEEEKENKEVEVEKEELLTELSDKNEERGGLGAEGDNRSESGIGLLARDII